MKLNAGFLILEKPAIVHARYLEFCDKMGWQSNVMRLRESLPFINPIGYRGISRNPLSAFPIADITELKKSGYFGVDVNTLAKLRMFELDANAHSNDDSDSSILLNWEHAVEVYKLLDDDQRDNYEIIKIIENRNAPQNGIPGNAVLGYDIGYWGGDFFSLICDCAIHPMWHPPAWDEIDDLAIQLSDLNAYQLFNQLSQAVNFRKYYKSRTWAETESSEDQFRIIQICACTI